MTLPRSLRLTPLAGAALILALNVGLTLLAARIVAGHVAAEAEARFAVRTGTLQTQLTRRLDDFRNLVFGMQGLFSAAPQTGRADFHRYSETLGLQQRLAGLQALSFQRRVLHAEKDRFVAAVRGDRSLDPRGYPGFAIRPPGERPEYLVIDYLEPMAANLSAFGYDAATQPPNLDAIRLATETGDFQASAPFNVVQRPDGPPRIVLRAPVYRAGARADTPEHRRSALAGFVVLTLETESAFGEAFSNMLMPGERLAIEDAGPSAAAGSTRIPITAIGTPPGAAVLERQASVEFGGRRLALQHSADASWLQAQPGQHFAAGVIAAGLAISLLLGALYLALATARQRALRLADERTRVLRATQDNMAQGISVVDRDLRLIGHNRRFLDLLDFPESLAADGASFADFVRYNAERGEYGAGSVDELVRARLELARRFEPHRLRRKRPDGTVLEIIGTPLPGGGMVTTYTDVTQQERAEDALRRSEQRHRTLVEMSPDAVFAHRDGVIQLANPAAARLFGAASPGQLVGYRVEQLVAPEDLATVRARIAALLDGKEPFVAPSEATFLRLDGQRVPVESLGALIELDGLPAVLTEARDISDRKRTESALRENEARFSRIIEQSPISMAIVGMDGRIEFVNRKGVETFGYAPQDIPDMDHWWRLAYPEAAYREEVMAQWTGLVGRAIAENREIEPRDYRVTCKDGSTKMITIFGVPVADKVFVMFDDITEKDRATRLVRQERDFRQHLIESIPGVFYLFDQEGRFLLWNRNFERVSGYSADEMAQLHPLDLFEGSDRERIEARIGSVFATGSSSAEALFRARDGSKRPYFFTGERVTLEDGRAGLVGVGFDLSERARAEETLARQTRILQATLESMDQGISVVDADLHMTALNRRFCELLDFPPDMGVAGAEFADFVRFNAARGEYGPCDVEEKVREMVERARHPQPHHFKRTRPNGRIIEVRGEPMEGGGFVTTYTDVTEQEQAQATVRRERDFRQKLIESVPGIFFLFDPSGRYLLWNKNLEHVLGMSAEEIAHSHTILLYDEADRDGIRRTTREAFARGAATTEATLVTKRGERIPYVISGLRIDVDGRQTVIGLGLDISERKRAETALRESEIRFRSIFEEALNGIAFATLDGTLEEANDSLAQLLGYSRDELQGLDIARFTHPDDLAAETAFLAEMRSGQRDFYRMDKRYLTKRGGVVWADLLVKLIRDAHGAPMHVVGLVADISERKHTEQVIGELNDSLERRVRERTAELEASNQELESFSYSVSHDLRAPLRALHGFSHLLAEEYAHRLDDNALGYLRRIQAASERMGNLIDDMLELARVSRKELKRVDVDLAALAGEIAAALGELAPQRRAEWRIAPGLAAKADPVLVRALLDNLLGNAWKFTAERDTALIEVGLARFGAEDVFFVRDNGAGFEMAYAGKLFQPFQRLHDAKRFEGTGIGLAIVHRIVRRHGGRVWAEGAPGEGATFYFTLP